VTKKEQKMKEQPRLKYVEAEDQSRLETSRGWGNWLFTEEPVGAEDQVEAEKHIVV